MNLGGIASGQELFRTKKDRQLWKAIVLRLEWTPNKNEEILYVMQLIFSQLKRNKKVEQFLKIERLFVKNNLKNWRFIHK